MFYTSLRGRAALAPPPQTRDCQQADCGHRAFEIVCPTGNWWTHYEVRDDAVGHRPVLRW